MKKPNEAPKGTKAAHDEFLAGMSAEERVMHVAAGAMALYSQFTGLTEQIDEMQQSGAPVSGDSQVAIPVHVVVGIWNVMGEMINLLETNGIIDKAKVEAHIAKKRAEIQSKIESGDKPEGWCPNCETVHGDGEDDETELPGPLRGVARAIVSMMMAARAERARQAGDEEAPEAVPKDATVH